jgi:arylsulfate sulfotransferase
MKLASLLIIGIVLASASGPANGTQADDTTITITAQNAGATPFISQLTLTASDTTALKSIQFVIAPKSGSVTRPLSGTYSRDYLLSRGYLLPPDNQIFLPVYGLYDGYANNVILTYLFLDGSSSNDDVTVSTPIYADTCAYETPTVLQPRTNTTALSYDYIMVKARCSNFSPGIIDTDSALRWVGPAIIFDITATFFDNAVYQASGSILYRLDLDGTITPLHDYSDIGVTDLHHNIDRGKTGLLLDADTAAYFESTNVEVDSAGNVLKTWNLADIISAAMIAGGDDPTQFVYPAPADWFHNNAVTYNRLDDSLVISSRENFVICLDYESGTIKWILGDPTKKWYQFPSLRQYALTLDSGNLPPIGQHAVSITYDQNLLLLDNGFFSLFQNPQGTTRGYASPRKYRLDLEAGTATEIWNYEMDQSIVSPICGSVYEDSPLNYLVDYAYVGGYSAPNQYAQLLGLDSAGETVFYYQYPTVSCNKAFSAIPLHLEKTKFPTVGPQALNLSTRGLVSSGEGALIAGFIVTGGDSKKVVLRALGPSLSQSDLTNTLADPVLTLRDSSGTVIATNDTWESDPGAAEIMANGLAPTDPAEAATVQTLAPGAYTVVAEGQGPNLGIGLVEAYDLSPSPGSKLANISTRAGIGTGDNVLIGGFIVGDVANASVVARALGPSLASAGVTQPLADPVLTVYDSEGSAIASNDDWPEESNSTDIQKAGLAPANAAESALALFLPAGAYSAIVRGVDDSTGVGLLEVYDLD